MIRLAIRVRRDDAELVLAELIALVPAGFEERELAHDVVEYAVYGAPGELPALPDLQATIGDALVAVSTSELPDDWPQRWKQFHKPVLVEAPARDAARPAEGVRVVPALYVRAPWIAASDRADALEISIDPGQAFGTGSHATTQLCLELLLALAATSAARGALIDVGTGSGVLAIAAAALGYGPVLALDVEQASVDAAGENAARNGVEIAVERLDLRRGLPAWHEPTVVLANLVAPLLLELPAALPAAPSQLIAGGLLTGEVDEVARAYEAALMLRRLEQRRSGEWAALWMRSDSASP
jgi:ribosomal protein L11 methyltransferase